MIRTASDACDRVPRGDAAPSAAAVRDAVGRVANSLPLRGSPRLVAFLRHVVERALAGESDRIKSYTIAVEALGRDQNFDPQADPIVRVEAGRLRHALALYYTGAGRDDPLVIALPRGSYVPEFHRDLAHGGRGQDRTALYGLSERLRDLRRQLAAITAEIDSTQTLLERAVRTPHMLD